MTTYYKNIKNVCRTCMSTDTNLTSLFAVLSLSNKEEPLNSILYKCTSIEVFDTDILPHYICNSCLEKLAICYLYRELCFDTQNRLQQLCESQKQLFSYVVTENNQLDLDLCVNPTEAPIKSTDFIGSNVNISYLADPREIVSDTINLPDIENNVDKQNLHQSCDSENLGCDRQNSCNETDEEISDIKKVNKEEKISCNICSKQLNSTYSLNRHLKTHSDCEKLKCHICLKKFTRAADVKRHMSMHTGDKPFSCTICQCSFTQSGTLLAHLRKHNGYENYKLVKRKREDLHLCSMCGKSFRHSSTLTVHIRRHLGDKPYGCDVCQLRFVSSGRLKSHRRVHTGERPFVCNICQKTFAHSTAISRHFKTHVDLKPHICTYCSKQFTTPYYLNIHIRQHTGEKPIKCKTCDKAFADPKNLKQHEKVHSDDKPYLCIVCGKSFRRSHHLKTHMKLHNKK